MARRPEDDPRWHVAIHESAHAVVGQMCVGHAVDYATVRRRTMADGSVHGGHVQFLSIQDSGALSRGNAYDAMVVALAGGIAQARVAPNTDIDGGASDDDKRVHRLATDAGMGTEDIVHASRTADEMVSKCWPHIEAVARELLRRERLTGAEIERIIAAASTRDRMKQHQAEVLAA